MLQNVKLYQRQDMPVRKDEGARARARSVCIRTNGRIYAIVETRRGGDNDAFLFALERATSISVGSLDMSQQRLARGGGGLVEKEKGCCGIVMRETVFTERWDDRPDSLHPL